MKKPVKQRQISPVNPDLLRAIELQEQGLVGDAEALFKACLETNPNDALALYSLGVIFLNRHDIDAALSVMDCGIKAAPRYSPMWFGHAMVLTSAGRREEALASYQQAIAIDPANTTAMINCGVLLRELQRHKESLVLFNSILEINPNDETALSNCAVMLSEYSATQESILMYERLLAVNPNFEYALGRLVYQRLKCCDWRDYERNTALITQAIRAGQAACPPLSLMMISDQAADQQICSQIHAKHYQPSKVEPLWRGECYQHDRIRIAYVSPDLREHPVGHLMAGVLELHDKTRFETIAISLGADDQSRLRARMVKAFDHFIDARLMGSRQIAELMRSMEVDIAVDLAGISADARPDVFAYRPAPIQVNYLGFPGTSGADHMDYILADRHVIPPEHQRYYNEKVVYLPDSYLPTDASVKISDRTPTRAECGLPETGFVFCSFSHDNKISPGMFDVWMRLLQQVPGSVLWLMSRKDEAVQNLRKEAQARGVSPDRLIFAGRVPLVEDHLARYRQADLFIDTFPYNAHTTAADALMAGLPVVTCMGNAFPSRVAGSLLHSIGLSELITDSLEDYEALALGLASNPERLCEIKAKLLVNRTAAPLFDTKLFCRNLESILVKINNSSPVSSVDFGIESVASTIDESGTHLPMNATGQVAAECPDLMLPQPEMIIRYSALPLQAGGFVVVGMFTPSHGAMAARLVESLQGKGLSYLIFEVPAIHSSISPSGTNDLRYTKANFIHHVLKLLRCPVLYVDVDVVFRKYPRLIDELVANSNDFAVLNWLALDRNDSYVPLAEIDISIPEELNGKIYRYSHQISLKSEDQLICSGAVQFWANTEPAKTLLHEWQEAVRANPGAQDDHCLDFAYNNFKKNNKFELRAAWLPKPYARYAWWIFDEPVIDHPQFPNRTVAWREISDQSGRQRVYVDRLVPKYLVAEIGSNSILDVRTGGIYKQIGDELSYIGNIEKKLWI